MDAVKAKYFSAVGIP